MFTLKINAFSQQGHDKFHVETGICFRIDHDQMFPCLESVQGTATVQQGLAVLEVANEFCFCKLFNGVLKRKDVGVLNLVIVSLHDRKQTVNGLEGAHEIKKRVE